MYQASVIYAPASPEMSALAVAIGERLQRRHIKVARKEASQATAPDLTAADLLVVGSTAQGKQAIHGDFSEILRTLKGMSLAGRTVGVFALRSEATLEAFAKALEDCEIPLQSPQFLVLPAADTAHADIDSWLSKLIEQLEAGEHVR